MTDTYRWQLDELSTDPGTIQVADTDRIAHTFAVHESIVSATKQMYEFDGPIGAVDVSVNVENPVIQGTGEDTTVTVIVTGFVRGRIYELTVTMADAADTRWTKRLMMDCTT